MAANFGRSTAFKPAIAVRPSLRLIRKSGDLSESPASPRDAAVLAYLSPCKEGNKRLLLKASEAAREAGVELLAVHVDTPRIFGGVWHARELIDDLILASALSARIVRLESNDPIDALLSLAKRSSASRIFVGRSEPSLLRRPVYKDLLRRADGFRVDIVGFERGRGKASA